MLSDIPVQLEKYWRALRPHADVPEFLRQSPMVEMNEWPSSFHPQAESSEACALQALALTLSNERRGGSFTTASITRADGSWNRSTNFAVITCPAVAHDQVGCEVVAMRSALLRVQLGPSVPAGSGLIGGFLGVAVVGRQQGEELQQVPLIGFRLRLETDADIDIRPKAVRDFWGTVRRMLGAS